MTELCGVVREDLGIVALDDISKYSYGDQERSYSKWGYTTYCKEVVPDLLQQCAFDTDGQHIINQQVMTSYRGHCGMF